ncbi:MAG: alpha/beta hydrolase, partial [Clostridia bacterium]|nr:alpha/beta hydrolase [Clostridia bacterium]
APTLLCWGTLDDATPLSDGETMEKLMPEAALVKFEGAGHYSFLECQAQFLRVLASFMNI